MAKVKIAVFSGPTSTIANSPTLVTSNKGRQEGERVIPGRYDHLAAQLLYEPVTVKIRKYTAHPMEEDARAVYQDDGKEYYEVELRPEDGPYPLPYVARRTDGSGKSVPFEESDLLDAAIKHGGRQFFYRESSPTSTAPSPGETIMGRPMYWTSKRSTTSSGPFPRRDMRRRAKSPEETTSPTSPTPSATAPAIRTWPG